MSCKVSPPIPSHFLPLEFTGTFPLLKVSGHLKGAPNISGFFNIVPDNTARCFASLSPRSQKEYKPNMEVEPTLGKPSEASIVIRCDKIRRDLFERSLAASKPSEDRPMVAQVFPAQAKEESSSKGEKLRRSFDDEYKIREPAEPKRLHVQEATQNAELIRTQQRFRKGCWRMVSTKTGTFLASISTTGKAISNGALAVRVMDPKLDVYKWPSTIVMEDQISRVFTSTSDTLDELITNLRKSQILKSNEVEKAFRFVDRALFGIENPYNDCAIDIGDKELGVCISSPHMHAWAAELLLPVLKNTKDCLDVGSGSGFFTMMLQYLAPHAKVYGLEYYSSLIETSQKVLQSSFPNHGKKIEFIQGMGERGCPGKQFDVIHVGFMCEELPLELIKQLNPGGRLLVPIWDGESSSFDKRCLSGHYTCIDKLKEGFRETKLFVCSFVPSITFSTAKEVDFDSPLSLPSMPTESETEVSPFLTSESSSLSPEISISDLKVPGLPFSI